MSEKLTVPLRYLDTEEQAERIKQQAAVRGLSVSAFLRSIVRQYTDPDGETLRRAAALVDGRVECEVDDA